MKSLFAASAVSLALIAVPAFAQDTSTMPKSEPSPQVVIPAPNGQPHWYTQRGNEMRASKLIGSNVKNDAGETIGSINEVVLDKAGRVAGVVIGVGGFLGIGEREVAVGFESLRVSLDSNDRAVVALNATKDALKAAPEWKWSGDRTGTTGTGAPANRSK